MSWQSPHPGLSWHQLELFWQFLQPCRNLRPSWQTSPILKISSVWCYPENLSSLVVTWPLSSWQVPNLSAGRQMNEKNACRRYILQLPICTFPWNNFHTITIFFRALKFAFELALFFHEARPSTSTYLKRTQQACRERVTFSHTDLKCCRTSRALC